MKNTSNSNKGTIASWLFAAGMALSTPALSTQSNTDVIRADVSENIQSVLVPPVVSHTSNITKTLWARPYLNEGANEFCQRAFDRPYSPGILIDNRGTTSYDPHKLRIDRTYTLIPQQVVEKSSKWSEISNITTHKSDSENFSIAGKKVSEVLKAFDINLHTLLNATASNESKKFSDRNDAQARKLGISVEQKAAFGRYQFTLPTLRSLGYDFITSNGNIDHSRLNSFLNDKNLQRSIMVRNTTKNLEWLIRHFPDKINSADDVVYYAAAMHHGGPSAAKSPRNSIDWMGKNTHSYALEVLEKYNQSTLAHGAEQAPSVRLASHTPVIESNYRMMYSDTFGISMNMPDTVHSVSMDSPVIAKAQYSEEIRQESPVVTEAAIPSTPLVVREEKISKKSGPIMTLASDEELFGPGQKIALPKKIRNVSQQKSEAHVVAPSLKIPTPQAPKKPSEKSSVVSNEDTFAPKLQLSTSLNSVEPTPVVSIDTDKVIPVVKQVSPELAKVSASNDNQLEQRCTLDEYKALAGLGDRIAGNNVAKIELAGKLKEINKKVTQMDAEKAQSRVVSLPFYNEYRELVGTQRTLKTEARHLMTEGAELYIKKISNQMKQFEVCRMTPEVHKDIARLVLQYNEHVAVGQEYGREAFQYSKMDTNQYIASIFDRQMEMVWNRAVKLKESDAKSATKWYQAWLQLKNDRAQLSPSQYRIAA